MRRLLLISLGKLSGYVLERLARNGPFVEIVVAGRRPEHGIVKTNLTRIGAAIEGRFPDISFVELDVNAQDAPSKLAAIAPDIAMAAPSLLPWWRLDDVTGKQAEIVERLPFAGWMACHLAPMQAVRDAWSASGLEVPWIGASYPDVVNAVLHRTGMGPTCGVGNVQEMVPKVLFSAAAEAGVSADAVEVRLVAQHALEYYLYHTDETPVDEAPPFLLEAKVNGRDVSAVARAGMLKAMPIAYDLDFNLLTASAAFELLSALAGDQPVRAHAPSPNGLIGGYPVVAGAGRITLDLPEAWSLEDAVSSNAKSLSWEGIDSIDDDGTVRFTDETADLLKDLLGHRVSTLPPDGADTMARELVAAVAD
ncbi:MAG: hypothetical protein HQ513_12585 [Rhodospirillales bacterium]|nr:hypothetical protein [Rhodospirillales bacterium]